jgi:hypothetical protein
MDASKYKTEFTTTQLHVCMSGLFHRPSMLLATPLRTRPDDLGSVILLPYQMRAV